MDEIKRRKIKALIKKIMTEDNGFMDALVGPESKFKDAIAKINVRAGILTKAAQDAQKKIKPK